MKNKHDKETKIEIATLLGVLTMKDPVFLFFKISGFPVFGGFQMTSAL